VVASAVDWCKTNSVARNEKQPQIFDCVRLRRTPLRMTKADITYAGLNKRAGLKEWCGSGALLLRQGEGDVCAANG
jgi:hypothetical protein